MNTDMHWNDLRIVLAITETGSLSAAGRKLGVSHATMYRHIKGIEKRLGVALFVRSRSGYSATIAGEEIAQAARRIENQVIDVERRVAGRDLRPSGIVRITTTDSLLFGALSPIFAQCRQKFEAIELEIIVSNDVFSLSKREADIAIRPASAPSDTLVGRKVGIIAQAIYCHRDMITENETSIDFMANPWIGPDEGMAYRLLDKWLLENALRDKVQQRYNTVLGMFSAVKECGGFCVLPCYLGDSEETLVKIGADVPALATDLWLLTHPDIQHTARVRVILDFIADGLKKQRPFFAGLS